MSDFPDVDEPGQIDAAPGSGLAALRGKRAHTVQSIHLDLPVQRSEEIFGQVVYVRYRPYTDPERRRLAKRFEKRKDAEADLVSNAVLLGQCTLGVFTAVERDTPDDWMHMDRDLAALLLGVDEGDPALKPIESAADVVQLLYVTNGDLMATAAKLSEWTGYSLEDLEEADSGN